MRRRPAQIARLALSAGETVVGALRGENLRLRAAALTYLSLFAFVPGLVVILTIVQAVSGTEALANRVSEVILSNIAVGSEETLEPYVRDFVHRAHDHAAGAGIIGAVVLLYSAISLFDHVERAINDIWAVRRRRSLVQQLLVYWAALTVGPVALAASVALSRLARAQLDGSLGGQLLLRLAAAASSIVFAILIYLVVPKTRVRLHCAAIGGVLAGVGWELAKLGYAFVSARFFKYQAVYGAVAVVPVFLIWLYLSWVLLLFGARVAYVIQNADALILGRSPDTNPRARELLAARAMLEVAWAFDRGLAPPEPGGVCHALHATAQSIERVFEDLREAGLIAESSGGGLVPSRPLARISLADVRGAVTGRAPEAEKLREDAAFLLSFLSAGEELAHRYLGDITFQALCDKLREQRARSPSSKPELAAATTPAGAGS